MKIVTILGARPQFIKASVLSNLLKDDTSIEEVIIHTGQHFDEMMSEIFFKSLDIPYPKYRLNISSLSHGAMTGRMLEKIESILDDELPDLVLVYGDTNSTLAGALAAVKLNIPVVHIEAGLRSFNTNMPEEINRKLTDDISTYLFCPTLRSITNLSSEGIIKNSNKIVKLVGGMENLFHNVVKGKPIFSLDLAGHSNKYINTIIEKERTEKIISNNLKLVSFEVLSRFLDDPISTEMVDKRKIIENVLKPNDIVEIEIMREALAKNRIYLEGDTLDNIYFSK
jgi:UDP-GlcNAc3NAcA epimerase